VQATIEYEPVVKKLLDKSEQGRLNWVKNPLGGLFCEIEGQYSFGLAETDDGYELTMVDPDQNVIFSIAGERAVVYDDPKKEGLFNMLRDLYQLARKKALNVDEKIATATGILDRI
jgi:hypothetical protein